MRFHFHMIGIKTRYEKEANNNREMVYSMLSLQFKAQLIIYIICYQNSYVTSKSFSKYSHQKGKSFTMV